MSKKNLARTAIEGGRVSSCRDHEHRQDCTERAAWRVYCLRAARDPEADEPRRKAPDPYIGRDFKDKLKPVRRWLLAQVGRPWDSVYAEIRRTFDFRTTAGRHIVDHIFDWVNHRREAPIYVTFRTLDGDVVHYQRNRFMLDVDAQGRLRKT